MNDQSTRRQVIVGAFEEALEDEGFSPPGYEVLEELDRGGMAMVYLARQLQPEREVALKVMLPRFAGEADMCERFQREGRAMAALDHSGILPVYQVGEWDGMAFLSMKLARGGTLQQRFVNALPDMKELVDWMIQVGEAVHFAHQHGILHRDLKPGNLLFDQQGGIYVGDFGVAKLEFAGEGGLTRTEALVGTPNYLAPEVAAGETNAGSVAADLYGLGAIFYEGLTGQRPHAGAENVAAQLRAVIEEELIPVSGLRPEVPRDLQVVCEKALAKNPSERYPSVAAFTEDLRRWREGRTILARPASLPERAWRWAKRYPLAAALSLGMVLTLVGGGLLATYNYRKRGELLHESWVERARGERLLRESGFRDRALGLLQDAHEIYGSDRIREEAVATLAYWDLGKGASRWNDTRHELPPLLEIEDKRVWLRFDAGSSKDWVISEGQLRCDPACSAGGRFLALVNEHQMELLLYDVHQRKEFSRVEIRDWPQRLSFGDQDERLKVVFEDQTAMLVNVRGEVLLDSFPVESEILPPIGFVFWEGQYLPPREANPYSGFLSADQKLLVTTSVAGVQIWNVEQQAAVDFYGSAYQSVDAPMDAWWVGERVLLLQVPGALERLHLSQDGRLIEVKEVSRVPGARVLDVLGNGDWLIERRYDEGERSWQLWPQGDSGQEKDVTQPLKSQPGVSAHGEKTVEVGEWTLTLPYENEVKKWFLLESQKRVIVLTQNNSVCEWNLGVLQRELEKRGF